MILPCLHAVLFGTEALALALATDATQGKLWQCVFVWPTPVALVGLLCSKPPESCAACAGPGGQMLCCTNDVGGYTQFASGAKCRNSRCRKSC